MRPKKFAIDSNMLQSSELASFLAASTANFAVLPDVLCLELHKQRSIEAVAFAFQAIEPFSDQIIILKPGKEIIEVPPGSSMVLSMEVTGVGGRIREMASIVRDLSFAVYGTYYDGFLAKDKRARWVYTNLRSALDLLPWRIKNK